MADLKVTAEDEVNLKARIEELTGGCVLAMTRQVRWRPSWFVDVKLDEDILKLYVRGDRQSDVVPFPELKREADIIRVLGEQGIPVPKIYGMCDDPVAIVMEASPGTRDVSQAANDAERRSVARQYIEAMVKMHNLPMEPFAAIGLKVPRGATEVALAGLEAYLPLYEKHKAQPEPFIEFAMKWLRNNIPERRSTPGFIAFDAGQFLFDEGKVTALYDFEFSMIGDPMADIATMAMRHSHEPMGEEIEALCAYYGELSGEPVDRQAIRYHHALFATVACMQFVGVIANPKPGDPHDVYLEWTLALRKSLVNVMAENIGVSVSPPLPLGAPEDNRASLYKMLADMTQRISPENELSEAGRDTLAR